MSTVFFRYLTLRIPVVPETLRSKNVPKICPAGVREHPGMSNFIETTHKVTCYVSHCNDCNYVGGSDGI